MKSVTTKRFRKLFDGLPADVQTQAKKSFKTWLDNQDHPSLNFKQVHPSQPIFSARVGLHYLAICVIGGDAAIWFWIGSHSDYDKLIASL